ncbi:hypothetical protein K461DRAFT_34966 [Myriangium duriaei CBS 260.36]|uniref:Uncharacterized protein n=1 Tax=Myriangium duriaei CBS 260.36 TaxID=1168546 RepID=A0A9P4IWJ2_9PEZI|nr:hypothetical protein K461DRAFT_34966 [Myriangium duriaei CBS 260.36]
MSTTGKRRREGSSAQDSTRKAPKRHATLYDAVAGRVGPESFLFSELKSDSKSTKIKAREGNAVYPEEVLFRQQRAPIRYEETDSYFAHENLDPERQRLPDSDLLKSIHLYASHFYSRATLAGGKWDYRSMDETALLALGILLEETMAHDLGPTADLAFVESDDADQGVTRPALWDGQRYRASVIERTRHTTSTEGGNEKG